MNEQWRDIEGFEGYYQISDKGRVKSLKRSVERSNGRPLNLKGRILTPKNNGHGYFIVNLAKGKRHVSPKIHRLVAVAFLDNPENKPQVNHIDGDKGNNCASNLEWVTPLENQLHAISVGLKTFKTGEQHHGSKLKERDVIAIRLLRNKYCVPAAILGKIFGISKSQILEIEKRTAWTCLEEKSYE